MKIIDYVKASKIKKTIGSEFAKELKSWKQRHQKMVDEFNNNSYKNIHVRVDEMLGEQLIFYTLSGNATIDSSTMYYIDTTVIDNNYDYTHNIYPTYILVKDKKNSKEKFSLTNTTLYRVTYNPNSSYSKLQYTIDTLVTNEDTATSKIFPELLCSLEVDFNTFFHEANKTLKFIPLKDHISNKSYLYREQFTPISELYEKHIFKQIKKFGNSPTTYFDKEKEF